MKNLLYAIIMVALLFGCEPQKTDKKEISVEEKAKQDSLAQVMKAREDSLRLYQAAQAESLRIAAEKERIKDLKNTINIINVYPSKPNSAGGVDAHTVWKNTSDKTIKYIRFEWEPYNAVGDRVACEIRGFRTAVDGI